MKMKMCFSLLLLLGLSQAHPILEEDSEPGVQEDISTMILASNNGSRQFLVEGDLVAPRTRNAMYCWFSTSNCLWRKGSDGLVTIPYTVSSDYSQWERRKIQRAVQTFNDRTCVRFVPRQDEHDYISMEDSDGCWSDFGRMGGKQVLSLNRMGCMDHGIIQHEINHALGFQHEHTRSDRDQHVRINWANIDRNMAYNFYKQNSNNLDTPYDYSSIMHYGKTAFSIWPGQDSITPIPNTNVQIGQRRGLSDIDILRINRLYGCRDFLEQRQNVKQTNLNKKKSEKAKSKSISRLFDKSL